MLKPEVLTDEQAEEKAVGLSFDHLPSKSEVHRTVQRNQTYKDTVMQIEEKLIRVTGGLVKPYRFINEDDWQKLQEEVKK